MKIREFAEKLSAGNKSFEDFGADDFIPKLFKELRRLDKRINAFRYLCPEPVACPTAYKDKDKDKCKGKDKNKGVGVPFSVKDAICTRNVVSSAGSLILKNYKPVFDATCVKLCKQRGMLLVGKTNQDEFGFGTFSTNCAFSIPKNPWNLKRCTGGSSGGSAALTAALKYPHVSIGESTGGSISCPAAFCGVVGLTPTYGVVSRYGLIDYANSLDKIGVIGKYVDDVRFLFEIIAKKDPKDATSTGFGGKGKVRVETKVKGKGKRMKALIPKEYIEFEINPAVKKKFWDAVRVLEDLGVDYEIKGIKYLDYAIPSYYIIAMAESSTNLAKFSGIRYGLESNPEDKGYNRYFSEVRTKGFGEEAKRRILMGTFCRMAGYRDKYYLKALKVRALIIERFKRVFRKLKYDIILAPTMPIIAPKFSEIEKLSPLEAYIMDTLTVGPNLVGIPHLSVPCGFADKMPVGLHIMGDYFTEYKIMRIAERFEEAVKVKKDPGV